jgi:hypothetical protein
VGILSVSRFFSSLPESRELEDCAHREVLFSSRILDRLAKRYKRMKFEIIDDSTELLVL